MTTAALFASRLSASSSRILTTACGGRELSPSRMRSRCGRNGACPRVPLCLHHQTTPPLKNISRTSSSWCLFQRASCDSWILSARPMGFIPGSRKQHATARSVDHTPLPPCLMHRAPASGPACASPPPPARPSQNHHPRTKSPVTLPAVDPFGCLHVPTLTGANG